MNLVFREVLDDAERDAVARLRYRIHVAEFGKRCRFADHGTRRLVDALDPDSILLAAFDGAEPVATVRLTPGTAIDPGSPAWTFYRFDAFAHYPSSARSVTSRLMVLPELRGTLTAAQLLAMTYERGRQLGTVFNFMHCAPPLVAVHEQMGFRRYTTGVRDPELGYRIPMILVADDRDWLASIRSPFAALSMRHPTDRAHAAWFDRHYAAVSARSTARTLGTDALIAQIRAFGSSAWPSALAGFDEPALAAILDSAVLHRFDDGFAVFEPGDHGCDLFCVLEGKVVLSIGRGGRAMPSAGVHLGPGESFGVSGYLGNGISRTAVTTCGPTTAMSLSRTSFEKLERRHPALAFRLVLNLARAASLRLESDHFLERAA